MVVIDEETRARAQPWRNTATGSRSSSDESGEAEGSRPVGAGRERRLMGCTLKNHANCGRDHHGYGCVCDDCRRASGGGTDYD